jgi:hypothetical protein
MTFKLPAALLAAACRAALLVILAAGPCAADALFVYELRTDDPFTGEKEAVMQTAFTSGSMYLDIKTQFVGSWMKRIFGKVTESRETTHFLLDQRQIREVNWHRGNVKIFALDRIADIGWISEKSDREAEIQDIIRERYPVSQPQIEITPTGETAEINGITARKIEASLRSETYDKRKNASSITLVKQELWVSQALPQYESYRSFFDALAGQLGLEAERLKALSFVLQYWEGSLDPIRDKVSAIQGLPVKSITTVEAVYVKDVGTAQSKTIRKRIKTETLELKSAQTRPIDVESFAYPDSYPIVNAK